MKYCEGYAEWERVDEDVSHSALADGVELGHGLEEVDLVQQHGREDGGHEVEELEDILEILS